MANLLLKIDPGSGYDDGDVICAWNRTDIGFKHGETLCHPRYAQRNSEGLILPGTLCYEWSSAVREFMFVRVSDDELLRVNLSTGEETLFGPQPNENGEHILVREFVARRYAEGLKLPMFGNPGREVWFGGELYQDETSVARAWNRIQQRSAARRDAPAYSEFPLGAQDKRSHLPIGTAEFDEPKKAEMLEGTEDRKRIRFVEWRDRLELSKAEVQAARDKRRTFDIRRRKQFDPRQIVSDKL